VSRQPQKDVVVQQNDVVGHVHAEALMAVLQLACSQKRLRLEQL
jgi:hypothetical protein